MRWFHKRIQFIEKLDELLFEYSSSIRDYVWFLKENDAESIKVFIIAFVDDSILAKPDVIIGALQDILPSQEFLKDVEVNIPTAAPECRKPLIMRHANNGLLPDCGFVLDFEFPEKQNNWLKNTFAINEFKFNATAFLIRPIHRSNCQFVPLPDQSLRR